METRLPIYFDFQDKGSENFINLAKKILTNDEKNSIIITNSGFSYNNFMQPVNKN